MSLPNKLYLFNNHFAGHRNNYPYRCTRLAIVADLGLDGCELHPDRAGGRQVLERESADAFKASGIKHAGMYVVAKGATDAEFPKIDTEIERTRRIIERLHTIDPKAFLNFTVLQQPCQREPARLPARPAHPRPNPVTGNGPRSFVRAGRPRELAARGIERQSLQSCLVHAVTTPPPRSYACYATPAPR